MCVCVCPRVCVCVRASVFVCVGVGVGVPIHAVVLDQDDERVHTTLRTYQKMKGAGLQQSPIRTTSGIGSTAGTRKPRRNSSDGCGIAQFGTAMATYIQAFHFEEAYITPTGFSAL